MCKADHFSLTAQALTDAFHALRCLKNLIMAKKKKWVQNLSEVIISIFKARPAVLKDI